MADLSQGWAGFEKNHAALYDLADRLAQALSGTDWDRTPLINEARRAGLIGSLVPVYGEPVKEAK